MVGDPLDRRLAVGVLAREDLEFPLRVEAPADVLNEHVIAALGHPVGDEEAGNFSAVGRTDENRREAARIPREVAIRDQLDTVRHRDTQAALDGDIMKGRRQPEQAGDEAAPVAVEAERGQPGDGESDRGAFVHLVLSSMPV